MKTTDFEQVRAIIENLDQSRKYVPFFEDLANHPVYGQFFNDLDGEEIEKIKELIQNYIMESIQEYKTKGGEMFRRFYAINKDIFRRFRELNASEQSAQSPEFQTLGKEIEQQLFKFEGILTQNMLKKPQ
ncbi:MAG: hypothetical protein H6765_03565 [Candidatus Peribacteria bacterium]|nr:MAG: hypothetical protein H6765_03565 [Candidatus Peribacteria bacterium]